MLGEEDYEDSIDNRKDLFKTKTNPTLSNNQNDYLEYSTTRSREGKKDRQRKHTKKSCDNCKALKQKISELEQLNEELLKIKEKLSKTNEDLYSKNQQLSQTNLNIIDKNKELLSLNKQLKEEKNELINKNNELIEEKVENKNDKIQREKINKNKKIRKYNRYNKKNYGIKFIEEIKNILSYYIDIEFPYILQIRCRLKSLHHSEDNFYEGCSICHKKIKNNKICCENSKKILLYNFFINVRDATGVVSIFFFNEQGRIFMGIDAEDYKKYLDDDSEVGRIILNKFKDEFFNNEYIFTIEFLEPQYKNSDIRKKKYSVIKTEIINKNHEHQLMKKLKNILNK